MDRFGRSLQFCHLELDKEAISDNCRSENERYWWGSVVLEDLVFILSKWLGKDKWGMGKIMGGSSDRDGSFFLQTNKLKIANEYSNRKQ